MGISRHSKHSIIGQWRMFQEAAKTANTCQAHAKQVCEASMRSSPNRGCKRIIGYGDHDSGFGTNALCYPSFDHIPKSTKIHLKNPASDQASVQAMLRTHSGGKSTTTAATTTITTTFQRAKTPQDPFMPPCHPLSQSPALCSCSLGS